jgi:hypothetical protein
MADPDRVAPGVIDTDISRISRRQKRDAKYPDDCYKFCMLWSDVGNSLWALQVSIIKGELMKVKCPPLKTMSIALVRSAPMRDLNM